MLAVPRDGWRRLTLHWRSSLHANSFYLIAANGVSAAFGFLFWTAASRLYPAQEVGLAAAAVSAIALLSMLAVLGLDYAMVRFLPQAADTQRIINSSLTIGGVAALTLSFIFIAGLGLWSPVLLPLQHNAPFVAALVISTVFTALSALLAGVFVAGKQANLVFFQSCIFSGAKVLFVVILAGVPQVMGLMSAWAMGTLVSLASGIAFFLPRIEGERYRFQLMLRPNAVSDMAHFAFSNYIANVLWSAPTFLLPLLVLNVAGPAANAYFYVALNVSALVAVIPMAISLSLFAHGSHDTEALVRHTVDSGRLMLSLLVPAIAAVFFLGGKILLVFGRSYSDQATRLLWVLALSTLPMTVNFLFFAVSRIQLRMAGVVACTGWILVVTLGLSAFLLPRMGLIGVGVAWLIAQVSAAVVILSRYRLRDL